MGRHRGSRAQDLRDFAQILRTARERDPDKAGGDNDLGKPKTFIVKFESYKDRDTVTRAVRKEKPRSVYVNEDLS